MALRDQPYLPLYVQDFLTDEKLNECSALACGVYIKLMCLMHKSEEYGTILLRQKDKQSTCQITNFATKLVKHLPYPIEDIIKGIIELTSEGCLMIDGDKLLQKRMIKDNEISIIRKESGSKGGFAKAKKVAKGLAKRVANTEYENEYETKTVIKNELVLKEEHILQKFIKKNCPNISKLKKQLTFQEADKLFSEFTHPELQSVIESMENYKPLSAKSISVNLTIRNWIKRDKQNGTDRKSSTRGSIDFNKWEREIRIARGEMPDVVPASIQR